MNLKDLAALPGFKLLTEKEVSDKQISKCYICDMLSHVISQIGKNTVWVTVQNNINIIAVAVLAQVPCIIVPENICVNQDVIERAEEEGVVLFSTDKTAYETAAVLLKNGLA